MSFEFKKDCPQCGEELTLEVDASVTGQDRPGTLEEPPEYAELEINWDDTDLSLRTCTCGRVIEVTTEEIEEQYEDKRGGYSVSDMYDGPDTLEEKYN